MTVTTEFFGYHQKPYHAAPFSYHTGGAEASLGMQFEVFHSGTVGMQVKANIPGNVGMQVLVTVDTETALAFEFKADTLSHISHGKFHTPTEGFMSEAFLAEKMCAFMGMQTQVLGALFQAMQTNVVIYNTNQIRIMCEFPSRGLTTVNWTATSTEPGDFDVNNVDTDIVEEIWRSATGVVSANLESDTGIPQGIFIDTIALLNHNLTSSATVSLLGSNSAIFASINETIVMEVTEDDMYYIAPEFPTASSRYWRIVINDTANPDTFLSIGTIIFGTSTIFNDECITDQIRFQLTDFADSIPTEGFTNVNNSRAIKKDLGIEFRSLNSVGRGFRLLRNIFKTARTTLKCLWIPTPSPTDQTVTGRFAVYGKLRVIPSERHNSKGPLNDFVDMTINVDESL